MRLFYDMELKGIAMIVYGCTELSVADAVFVYLPPLVLPPRFFPFVSKLSVLNALLAGLIGKAFALEAD